MSSRLRASQGQPWTKSRFRLTTDLISTIHQGLSTVTRWLHYLTAKNLKYVSPKKEIKPKTYQLNPEQTLFLGGLGRFDFIAGEKQGFTAFFDNELKLHRTKLEGASAFYDKHLGTLLTPPNSKEKEDFPKLVQTCL